MKGNDSMHYSFIKGKDGRNGCIGLPTEMGLKRLCVFVFQEFLLCIVTTLTSWSSSPCPPPPTQ